MSRPRLLITGFEPFAHYTVNPSGEAAVCLGREFAAEVIGERLPVDYFAARMELLRLLETHQPSACLCMGLADEPAFRLELRARKVRQFQELPGAASHISSWRWESISASFGRMGVPWRFSEDCGLYVCESTFWTLLQHSAENGWPTECGFLHVPAVSMDWPIERTVAAVREVVMEWVRYDRAAQS